MSSKPPAKSKEPGTPAKANGAKAKGAPESRNTPNGRGSARSKKSKDLGGELTDDELLRIIDADNDPNEGDDVFNAEFKKSGKGLGDDYEESEEDEDVVKPRRVSGVKGKPKTLPKDEDDFNPDEDVDMKDEDPDDDFVVPDGDEEFTVDKPAKGKKAKEIISRKRKSDVLGDEEEDETPKKGKGKKSSPTKKSPAKKSKKEDIPESDAVKAIYDSIPLVRPPTPTGGEAKKFQYGQHANAGPAPAQGAKERPTGATNCLAGLTFVFTGLLETIDRPEATTLVKQYGGKVTGAPSKNTSFVVLGNDAGPKKVETIRKNNIKTINEDGLFDLIRKLPANGGDSKAAAKYEDKAKKEAEKVKQMAEEIEKEERRAGGAGGAGAVPKSIGAGAAKGKQSTAVANESRLWTVKYAPNQTSQICGNKGQVEKLQRWLRAFPKSQRVGFKLAGADGSGTYRAVIIHGPPGVGKTTAAHLVAKLEGYDIVESNASDTRSKKLVETGLKGVLSTTSLLGYFAGDGQSVQESKKKLVLIMDEVDGMSAGDRGGVGALAAVCKKTQIPMILICNDRRLPKMKPFDFVTYNLPFHRPTVDQIRSRIMTIAYREGLKMPAPVIDALIEGSGADIRQIVNMVSTAKLDQTAMDFDTSKKMSKAWEKHVILKPWDITSKILGGGMFAQSSKATLNEKIELYFNDHEFSYLMLQENYMGTNPILANIFHGREKALKQLELVDNAAQSISDGDLVDRMIHGSQQQWSLMPTHAVFSFVRPASFISGSMAGHRTGFTSWLGMNSKHSKSKLGLQPWNAVVLTVAPGKLARFVKEIQGHMRLRSSGDRNETRQQYVPILWEQLVKRLERDGKDVVPEVIELMDSYFLTKEDFDAIMELGVGPMDQENTKIEPKTKSTFTRL